MAFAPQQFYGQPTGFASYAPQHHHQSFFGGYPTTFASAAPIGQQFAVADHASQHEGSQAGGESHAQSVSGFAAQPIDAGFGQFYGGGFAPQATFIGGQQYAAPLNYGATVLPHHGFEHTVLPAYGQVVPAQVIRRPGYNERLVAWRNRQKAFNRYKRDTKQAIKHSNTGYYQQQTTVLAAPHHQHTVLAAPSYYGGAQQATILAAPQYGSYGAFPAYGGATYLAAPQFYGQQQFVNAGEVHDGQEQQYGEFSSFSNQGAVEQQQEEPEIRGTQV